MIRLVFLFFLIALGCSDSKHNYDNLSPKEINSILGQFSETDEVFTQKGIEFDSVITLAGARNLNAKEERIKIKLFFFGNHCRGYYNLPTKDDKNLQVFGKMINNDWILKCVTKLNMEEAGGYIMLMKNVNGKSANWAGIWSNGDVNFKMGKINISKNTTDYNILTDW